MNTVSSVHANTVYANPMLNYEPHISHTYSRQQIMDDLAQRLGKHYGLNDIREAK